MTLSRAQNRLVDTLSLSKHLRCVLSCMLNVNELNVLHTLSVRGIILRRLRQPFAPLRFTNSREKSISPTGKTILPYHKWMLGLHLI
jgi:hypothetical protein